MLGREDEPSAFDEWSAFSSAATRSCPPAVTTVAATVARLTAAASVRATAAAAFTLPSLVAALGLVFVCAARLAESRAGGSAETGSI